MAASGQNSWPSLGRFSCPLSVAFAAVLPERRPLEGLDVGSGTGRYTPALARAFGQVTGVEPSVRMREIAQRQSQHPDSQYLAGSRAPGEPSSISG